jgi:xanthine dehydrogenase molybdopterin-binding subunit B
MLALSVIEALRDAVANIRAASHTSQWPRGVEGPMVHLDAPATPERVFFAIRHRAA